MLPYHKQMKIFALVTWTLILVAGSFWLIAAGGRVTFEPVNNKTPIPVNWGPVRKFDPNEKRLMYLRRNSKSEKLYYWDPETKEGFEGAFMDDIDVSYDGKAWFHLFGQHCLRDSLDLRLADQ